MFLFSLLNAFLSNDMQTFFLCKSRENFYTIIHTFFAKRLYDPQFYAEFFYGYFNESITLLKQLWPIISLILNNKNNKDII